MTVDQISEFLASKATVSAGDRGYKYLCDWVTQNSNKLCTKSENPNQEVLGALEDGPAAVEQLEIWSNRVGCEIVKKDEGACLLYTSRKNKDWSESDKLRDIIKEKGYIVKDSKEGQTIEKT